DALGAAQDERVVDLVSGALHAVRQPIKHMLGVVMKHTAHVVEPWSGLSRVAGDDRRRPIEIEALHAAVLDPAALGDQPALDDHWQAGCPCHLLDWPIAVEPRAGGNGLWPALISADWVHVRRHRALPSTSGRSARHGTH